MKGLIQNNIRLLFHLKILHYALSILNSSLNCLLSIPHHPFSIIYFQVFAAVIHFQFSIIH